MHIHETAVARAREMTACTAEIEKAVRLYKLLGDGTRMRILCALAAGEMCVCAITELLGMDQSAVSHQLKALRDGRMVTCRRDGKTMYYSLADEHVAAMVARGLMHAREAES